MGNDEADQPHLQLYRHDNKAKENKLLQNKPQVI